MQAHGQAAPLPGAGPESLASHRVVVTLEITATGPAGASSDLHHSAASGRGRDCDRSV